MGSLHLVLSKTNRIDDTKWALNTIFSVVPFIASEEHALSCGEGYVLKLHYPLYMQLSPHLGGLMWSLKENGISTLTPITYASQL